MTPKIFFHGDGLLIIEFKMALTSFPLHYAVNWKLPSGFDVQVADFAGFSMLSTTTRRLIFFGGKKRFAAAWSPSCWSRRQTRCADQRRRRWMEKVSERRTRLVWLETVWSVAWGLRARRLERVQWRSERMRFRLSRWRVFVRHPLPRSFGLFKVQSRNPVRPTSRLIQAAFIARKIDFLLTRMPMLMMELLMKWIAMRVIKWIIHVRVAALLELPRWLHKVHRRSHRRTISAQPSSVHRRIGAEWSLGGELRVRLSRSVEVIHRAEMFTRLVFSRVQRAHLGWRRKLLRRWSRVIGNVDLNLGGSRDLIRCFLGFVLVDVVVLEGLRLAVDYGLLDSCINALHDIFWVMRMNWVSLKMIISNWSKQSKS